MSSELNNPSVRLVPHLPPPLAQGRLEIGVLLRRGRQEMRPSTKKSPARGQNRLLFSPISCKMMSAFRERVSRPCRDGGAAERARFEIVLGSDVYQGSNPCLCAKKRRGEITSSFFGAQGLNHSRRPRMSRTNRVNSFRLTFVRHLPHRGRQDRGMIHYSRGPPGGLPPGGGGGFFFFN